MRLKRFYRINNSFFISRMKLKIHFFVLAALICVVSNAQSLSENIRLDQLGFYPNTNKIAIVVGETATDDFFITTADHKDTVYAGKLGEQQQSKNSSLVTHVVDFSTLKKQGTYIVDVPGVGYSYQFK